jgi:hypothetical protein
MSPWDYAVTLRAAGQYKIYKTEKHSNKIWTNLSVKYKVLQ